MQTLVGAVLVEFRDSLMHSSFAVLFIYFFLFQTVTTFHKIF